MKIIQLITTGSRSAAALTAADMCIEHHRRGHQVVAMIRSGHEEIASHLRDAGISTVSAPLRGAFDPLSPVRLSKLLADAPENRTVIHVYKMTDAVTAARARMLASRQDVKIIVSRYLTRPAKTGVSATAIYSEIDNVVFPSRWMMQRFMESKPDMEESKLTTMRFASRIPAETNKSVAVADSQRVNILAAGEITPGKGLDTLITALSKLSDTDWHLTVVGEGIGPVVMPIIRMTRDLGIAGRIDWKGYAIDTPSAARSADIAVCPEKTVDILTSEFNIFTATGTPLIASDLPLHRDYAEGAEGVRLFKAGDADALADAIRETIAEKGERRSRAVTDFARFAADMENLYLKLLS